MRVARLKVQTVWGPGILPGSHRDTVNFMVKLVNIDTTDLMTRWDDYGAGTSLVVYLEVPHRVQSITEDKKNVWITTDRDILCVPRHEKHLKKWRILE